MSRSRPKVGVAEPKAAKPDLREPELPISQVGICEDRFGMVRHCRDGHRWKVIAFSLESKLVMEKCSACGAEQRRRV